ncbi:hypothetical protein CRENBAI_019031 [Crenichthys baileyi]|uniref:Uncharacterized protein n=1 Tax=Crenichthys baileyi TaxID=28760 RepID=A0AAV9RX33_9TELE
MPWQPQTGYSPLLSFLDPFVTPRPTTSNMGQIEEMAEDLPAPAQDQETEEAEGRRRVPSRNEPSDFEGAHLEALQKRPPPPTPPWVLCPNSISSSV